MTRKTIFDFMADKPEYDYEGFFRLKWHSVHLYAAINDLLYEVYSNSDLIYIVGRYIGMKIRICSRCGRPIREGYTNDGGWFYNCEECFPLEMDEVYGKGNWRPIDTGCANSEGGYYEYLMHGEWHDDASYYTEWY